MPSYPPPPAYDGTPHRFLLPANTILWRIHDVGVKATDFTPYRPAAEPVPWRFAGTADDPVASWHGSEEPGAIIADLLLHSKALRPDGPPRTISRATVRGRRASALTTLTELGLLSLLAADDLDAVGQDGWLVHCADLRDPMLPRWTSWLRAEAADCVGFIWMARRTVQLPVVVLFGDRATAADIFDPDPIDEVDLADELGAYWLNWALRGYGARIMPPAKR